MTFCTKVCLQPSNDRGEFELDRAKGKNSITENSFALGHETDSTTDLSNNGNCFCERKPLLEQYCRYFHFLNTSKENERDEGSEVFYMPLWSQYMTIFHNTRYYFGTIWLI